MKVVNNTNPKPAEINPLNSLDNSINGLGSDKGKETVRLAFDSGKLNTLNTGYNSDKAIADLKTAFQAKDSYQAVKDLLVKKWGWKETAFYQVFPKTKKNEFGWEMFNDQIQSTVKAYDRMDPEAKRAYCTIRDLTDQNGKPDVNRGWATYSEFAPNTCYQQAEEVISKAQDVIVEISKKDSQPNDDIGRAMWIAVDAAKKTFHPALITDKDKVVVKDRIKGWPEWLTEAIYLRFFEEMKKSGKNIDHKTLLAQLENYEKKDVGQAATQVAKTPPPKPKPQPNEPAEIKVKYDPTKDKVGNKFTWKSGDGKEYIITKVDHNKKETWAKRVLDESQNKSKDPVQKDQTAAIKAKEDKIKKMREEYKKKS